MTDRNLSVIHTFFVIATQHSPFCHAGPRTDGKLSLTDLMVIMNRHDYEGTELESSLDVGTGRHRPLGWSYEGRLLYHNERTIGVEQTGWLQLCCSDTQQYVTKIVCHYTVCLVLVSPFMGPVAA